MAPLVTACIQLGPVPILLHAWGAAKYGDWLILSALPAYLSISDMGFGDASGSDMTVRAAAGDHEGAIETFHSSWLLLTAVASLLLSVIATAVWWVPWKSWLNLSSITNHDASWVALTLAAYAITAQFTGILESGFRCDGHFATGNVGLTLMRLAESLVATAVGITANRGLLPPALAYLTVRLVSTVAYGLVLRRLSPWIVIGFSRASLKVIRRLSGPAAGFIAMPMANAVSFQGFTVLIGAVLGSTAVTAFSTIRTLTRVGCQLLTMVQRVLWPELSAAFGSGDIPLARRLHRYACQAGISLAFLSGAILWIVGPYAYHLWVRDAVSFDSACYRVLLVDLFVNALWLMSSVVPMSTNVHQKIAIAQLSGTVGSLLLAWILLHPYGNTGAAIALFAPEVWMCWVVLPTAFRQVHETPREFLAALVRIPRFSRARLAHERLGVDKV
jgi:O-antigen/teichoic acid export membrane protein